MLSVVLPDLWLESWSCRLGSWLWRWSDRLLRDDRYRQEGRGRLRRWLLLGLLRLLGAEGVVGAVSGRLGEEGGLHLLLLLLLLLLLQIHLLPHPFLLLSLLLGHHLLPHHFLLLLLLLHHLHVEWLLGQRKLRSSHQADIVGRVLRHHLLLLTIADVDQRVSCHLLLLVLVVGLPVP